MTTRLSPQDKLSPREKSAPTRIGRLIRTFNELCRRIPESLITFLGRFSIAAIFWKSGQTKIEGFAVDIIDGNFQLGWPRLSESALDLFRDEYRLPFMSPELAAPLTAFAELFFPALLLIGLATRFSAFALLVITLIVQVFVYPDAYPTHGVWATVLLFLIVRGGGILSLDHWLASKASYVSRWDSTLP